MHERLKQVRLEKKMNQSEFAKMLGMGQSTLGMMEVGKRDILDRHIKTICSMCNVNEDWFKFGTGEMFNQTNNSIIDELIKEFNGDDTDKAIIETYLQLPESSRAVFKQYLIDLCAKIVPSCSRPLSPEEEIDHELALERQERIAELQGKTLSVSENTNDTEKMAR